MRSTIVLFLVLGPVAAHSAGLVSDFDFAGTLSPRVNNNPAYVPSLFALHGNANPTAITPSYSTALVGSTTKQVLNFAMLDTLLALHGIGANGGGSYVNQYTMMMDVRFDGQASGNYTSLFNTNATNSNDGDSFLKWGAGNVATVGISGDYAGSVSANDWHRLAISVDDSTTGLITYYLDGAQIQQHNIGVSVDGRWAMYTYNDNDLASDGVFVFGDNDTDLGSGQISQLAFFDHALSLAEVRSLGIVGQPVPEPGTFAVLGLGGLLALGRRKRA